MAKESVKKFYEELSKNEDMKNQLAEAQTACVVDFAKKSGYEFTVEELNAEKERLDLSNLDSVAGGRVPQSFIDENLGKFH